METTTQIKYREVILALFQEAYEKYKRVRQVLKPLKPYAKGEYACFSRGFLYTTIKADNIVLAKPRRVQLAGRVGLGHYTDGVVLGHYVHMPYIGVDAILGPMTLDRSYEIYSDLGNHLGMPYLRYFHEILPHGSVLSLGQSRYPLGTHARLGAQKMHTFLLVRIS